MLQYCIVILHFNDVLFTILHFDIAILQCKCRVYHLNNCTKTFYSASNTGMKQEILASGFAKIFL